MWHDVFVTLQFSIMTWRICDATVWYYDMTCFWRYSSVLWHDVFLTLQFGIMTWRVSEATVQYYDITYLWRYSSELCHDVFVTLLVSIMTWRICNMVTYRSCRAVRPRNTCSVTWSIWFPYNTLKHANNFHLNNTRDCKWMVTFIVNNQNIIN